MKFCASALSAALALSCLLVVGPGPVRAQEAQERTIRWGHLNNTDHPVSFGVQKFGEVLAAKSGGKLKVREFAASQLGNEMQQQAALRGGTQEMFSASTTSLATVIKDFGLFDFPFIVGSIAQADALATGAYGQAMARPSVRSASGWRMPPPRSTARNACSIRRSGRRWGRAS